METARERYEAKTKVVTFRVSNELYQELMQVKAASKLSFADLIKLGAGISQQKAEAKLAEVGDLVEKLEQLKSAVSMEEQKLAEMVSKKKQEQLAVLNREIEAYRLYDLHWTVEEVGFKLGIGQQEAYNRFREWGRLRKQRKAVQDELIKRCLQRHIGVLEEYIMWRAYGKSLEEAKAQLEHCRLVLIGIVMLSEVERTFLLTEYSNSVSPYEHITSKSI